MKQRTTVAVDVDDVLVPHGDVLIDHLNGKFRTEADIQGFFSLDELMEAYGRSRQEIKDKIHDFLESEEFARMEPAEESIRAIEKLKRYYELTIVTARPGIAHNMTREWLEQHFPETFQSINFTNLDYEWGTLKKVSKRNVCEALAADYLVDDSLKHIAEVAECGMKGILFGSYHWNQADTLPPGCVRAENWDEVINILVPSDA